LGVFAEDAGGVWRVGKIEKIGCLRYNEEMLNEIPKTEDDNKREQASLEEAYSVLKNMEEKALNVIETEETLLPKVEIKENPTDIQKKSKGSMSHMDFIISSDKNEEIGRFTLTTLGRAGNKGKAYINGIKFKDEFRGKDKNYSKAVWLEIIKKVKEDNKTLFTGWTLTKGSDLVWQWLVENNYAKITQEGKRYESNKGPGYSTYDYESL
jgi:hypothetical protein